MRQTGTLAYSHPRVGGHRPEEAKDMRDIEGMEADPEAAMGKGQTALSLKSKL